MDPYCAQYGAVIKESTRFCSRCGVQPSPLRPLRMSALRPCRRYGLALADGCTMAQLAALSAADLDGLIRVVQNFSLYPTVSVNVDDAADEAVKTLRMIQ